MSISIKDNNYFREFGSVINDWERRNIAGIIYRIVNLINGKSYIGQTLNTFNIRYGKKWWLSVDNEPLERAIVKYGYQNFKIEIWEYNIKTVKQLNKLETMYILLFNTFSGFGEGYNLNFGGGNRALSPSTKEKLSDFNSKTYILIDINNKEYIVTNLRKFCKERNLKYNSMLATIRGELQGTQGFGLKNKTKRIYNREINKVYILRNREGTTIKGSITDLSKIINCYKSDVYRVISQEISSCGGWFLPESDINKITFRVKHNIKYKFQNKEGKIIEGTITELSKITSLHQSNISRMIGGTRKSCKGWSAITNNIYKK